MSSSISDTTRSADTENPFINRLAAARLWQQGFESRGWSLHAAVNPSGSLCFTHYPNLLDVEDGVHAFRA